jgi:serine protease Do
MKFLLPLLILATACSEEPPVEVPAGYAALFVDAPNGTCSGVSISAREFLTAAHCLAGPDGYVVTRAGGETSGARVVKESLVSDVALLELLEGETDFAEVAEDWETAPIERGDTLTYVGFGCDTYVRSGKMIGVFGANRIGHDGEVCHGDSGGPAFDENGELVGLVTHKFNGDRVGGYISAVKW